MYKYLLSYFTCSVIYKELTVLLRDMFIKAL